MNTTSEVSETGQAPVVAYDGESSGGRFWRRFRAQKFAMVMLAVIVLLIVVAIAAPWIMPDSPTAQTLSNTLAKPSGAHLLGTDDLGRDFLSRLIAATRVTMYAGALATVISVAIGLPLGLIAGYKRGAVDATLSRINDALMAIPTLLLAMAIVAVLGFGVTKAMLAIGIATAPRFFRIARGMAIVVREETFIEAARSIGCPMTKIIRTHVLPNVLSPLIVQISLTVGFSILFEAGLSFLGLGVQAPDASWGSLLQKAVTYASTNPLLVLLPGLLILLTVLAFNTVGDAIRDSLGREVRR
ncbi:peptide/nickel transport system permease protein [Antricoccus suffuscus]|uniref:Peptide/nickel transport system permease protein n=1 Tax=Antricoccus suffuscus TaxID=1629062 RepID=A0A2T1A5Y9_9ACTN|nr:ABC transporter permease [Antricoccus suffuscus]PRZ44025.1 peptide/nickel transport system permease protein [Antricoccus suffuscus]